MLPLLVAWTYQEGLPLEIGIPGFRDSTVPVSGGTGEDIVYSFTAKYMPDEPISVLGSCTGTSRYKGRLERPNYGPRPTGRDVRGSRACLAITPPVESADWPVIQGTFFLSRL